MQPDRDLGRDGKLAASVTPYSRLAASPEAVAAQLTSDVSTTPKGVDGFRAVCASILVVELAERLCFNVFAGSQEFFLEKIGYDIGQSAGLNASFNTLCYIWPLLGGYLADAFWGRFKTIIVFASIYFVGTSIAAAAALPGDMRNGPLYLFASMGLIALGTGGIKPNISNLGADQYDVRTTTGKKAQEAFYTQFYMAINAGSLMSYGGLTTLCSNGGPGVPRRYGYFAGYSIGAAAMALALICFGFFRKSYIRKPPGGNVLRGVIKIVASSARRGSPRGCAVFIGCPLVLVGVLLTIMCSFNTGQPVFAAVASLAILFGLLCLVWGCSGDLAWVRLGRRNGYISRQATIDFLRINPTLITVNLAFNAMYNCMNFWYQQQACQMDLRVHGEDQLNGSFFNVADCISVVVLTPLILTRVNPWLERALGGFSRHRKVLLGLSIAAFSLLWAAKLEISRRAAPLLAEQSECAPKGVKMSDMSSWWMLGPYGVMGVAEVYVNPTMYFLAYSQTPLRLRSTAQAVCLLMGAISSALFTVLTKFLPLASDLNNAHLEYGYYASLALAFLFVVWYILVQASLVEKDFDHPVVHDSDESEVDVPNVLKEVAYARTGFFKNFVSPRSPAGSPAPTPPSSPEASPAGSPLLERRIFGEQDLTDHKLDSFVLIDEEPSGWALKAQASSD